jgi:hypothetical protein
MKQKTANTNIQLTTPGSSSPVHVNNDRQCLSIQSRYKIKPNNITKFLNMKKLSFLAACLVTLFASQAQTDPSIQKKKQKAFNVSVRTLENKTIKGRLYAVTDSQVLLTKSLNKQLTIPAENIRSFTIKRKNSALRGGLIGFGIGLVTGVIIGLVSGNDPVMQPSADDLWGISAGINNMFAMTAGEKAIVAGLTLGTGGAIIGGVIGALAKKKFTIGGKRQKFRDLQSEIMMKIIQN